LIKRPIVALGVVGVLHGVEELVEPNQTKLNQTKLNQTKPNQTKKMARALAPRGA
jgi:hypothetical protein